MAAHNTSVVKALVGGYIVVAGSFAPNAGSAVSAASNKGKGWTVARTSAGLFTITFDAKYTSLVSAVATAQLATAADINAQVGSYVAASKTLTIRTIAVATETDVAANANNRINFICVFDNSARLPLRG